MHLVKLIIYGEVQGVGYRNSVYQFVHNNLIFVKGYVRNLSNGSVELMIQGDREDVRRVEDFCYKGSDRCRVDNVEKLEIPGFEDFSDFEIRYD